MRKKIISFIVMIAILVVTLLWAATTGSVNISYGDFLSSLFGNKEHELMPVIRDLRFPRIIIAVLAGASLAVAGALLQAIMRNPLADAGVIGISSGASFASLFVITFIPQLFFWSPLFAFIGGALACFLVFFFSWKSGLNPLKLVLVGIAINAIFTGLKEAFIMICSYAGVTVDSGTSADLTMKTWSEVDLIVIYGSIGLILALLLAKWCNLLMIQDKSIKSLGFNVTVARLIIAAVAVLLSGISTAVAGVIPFVGLLIPHIASKLVGRNHAVLIPFSALAGGWLILMADTLGRTLVSPQEIPASTLMALIGGPFLIFLLRKE